MAIRWKDRHNVEPFLNVHMWSNAISRKDKPTLPQVCTSYKTSISNGIINQSFLKCSKTISKGRIDQPLLKCVHVVKNHL